MVKTSNRALVDPLAVMTPLPVPAPAGVDAQQYTLRPAAWPAAGYTCNQLMHLAHDACNELMQAYHLVLPPRSLISAKRKCILAHLGMDPSML
jgi:hypothetical protein